MHGADKARNAWVSSLTTALANLTQVAFSRLSSTAAVAAGGVLEAGDAMTGLTDSKPVSRHARKPVQRRVGLCEVPDTAAWFMLFLIINGYHMVFKSGLTYSQPVAVPAPTLAGVMHDVLHDEFQRITVNAVIPVEVLTTGLDEPELQHQLIFHHLAGFKVNLCPCMHGIAVGIIAGTGSLQLKVAGFHDLQIMGLIAHNCGIPHRLLSARCTLVTGRQAADREQQRQDA